MLRIRTTATCLLLLCVALVASEAASPDRDASAPTVIYLVRHAEKTDEGSMADLSDQGRERAEVLARMLRDVSLDAVFSTDVPRTKSTVAPVAKAKGLTITHYKPRAAALARRLEAATGQALLVCGHSDTIPQLLGELGTPIEDKILPGYDDLFVVILTRAPDGATKATLQRLHYPSGAEVVGESGHTPG